MSGARITTRLSFALAASALVMLAAPPAAAQCTEPSEARALRKSLRLATKCNYRMLRSGPGVVCKESPPPECAGTLGTDALALAYGRNNPPASAVDRRELRTQLRCQYRVAKAVGKYVSTKLRLLIRGVSPEIADARARKRLDKLPEKCALTVVEDLSGVVLPEVGPQCAAAVGTPGSLVDGAQLRDCLHTLLEVWVDRFGPDPQPLRPNIVMILTDDQRWDTTDATHSPSTPDVMPQLRAELEGSGIEFTQVAMTTSVCCPSRASILRGQYAHTTGIHKNKSPNGGADEFDDSSTIGTWLQAAGYRTGFFGKYMNGYQKLWVDGETPYVPPGWSEWHVFKNVRFFDYTLVRNGVAHDHEEEYYGTAEEDYSTDVLRDLAVDFINSSVAQDQPFFLYLNPKAPHLPKEPAPRHVGMFADVAPWRPESYNEPDVSDKPQWLQDTPQLTPEEQEDLDQIRISQLEMLQAVDEAVGAVMQALRDNGIDRDTIVVYFSDNGWLWGEHRLQKKLKPYEEAIRSPMFVRYPRLIPLPRKEDRIALNIDLGPTFATLAGASSPIVWDGMSFERVLDSTAPDWRTDFLTEGWPSKLTWASVREADWKYTEYLTGEIELYDLVNDPLELENAAGDPAHADRIAAMAARLREIRPGWPDDAVPPECGDGVVEAPEECDPPILGSDACPGPENYCWSDCTCTYLIGNHQCVIDPNHSGIQISTQALPQSWYQLVGAVDISCGVVDPANGRTSCSCALQSLDPIHIVGIGYICFTPGTGCGSGKVDCDGGWKNLDITMDSDHNIGACTGHPDCSAQCTDFCALQGANRFFSSCGGFCLGGPRDGQSCMYDSQCPGGSCPGQDGLPHGNECQCDCWARGGSPSPPGGLRCRVPTKIDVEPAVPCGDGDVLISMGRRCIPLTTGVITSQMHNVNNTPGKDFPRYCVGGTKDGDLCTHDSLCPGGVCGTEPYTATGVPGSCDNLTASITTGLKTVGAVNFFDSAIGDLATFITISCQ